MEQDIELIHNYIKGVLTNDEQQLIVNRIQIDSAFANTVNQERVLLAAIGQAERASLKAALPQTTKKSNSNYKWYAVAAIVPLLVVAYFLLTPTTNPQNLYNEYYEPYGNYELGMTRSESDNTSTITSISQAYTNGEYQIALDGLNPLITENPSKTAYVFYRGICYMELNATENAQADFKSVANTDSNYSSISKWYLALSYLKQDNIEECKTLLKELKTQNNGLGKKYEQLLKAIE